jgi:hypothetical protein
MELCGRCDIGDHLRVGDRHVSISTHNVAENELERRLISALRLLNLLLHDRLHVVRRDRVVTRLL